MGTIGAVIGAAVIGAGASVYSATKQSNAAKKAAETQAEAYGNATSVQMEMFEKALADQKAARDQSIKLTEPWREAGENALKRLQLMVSKGPGKYSHQDSPSYQFEMGEGENAINRNMAARGLSNSGAALKSLQGYSQGLANKDYWTGYQNHMNRYYQSLTPYQSLAGIGMTTIGNQQNAIQGYANNAGNLMTQTGSNVAQNAIGAGNAGASGYINQANAFTGGMNSMTNNLMNGMLMYKLFGSDSDQNTPVTSNYNYYGPSDYSTPTDWTGYDNTYF